MYLLSCRWSRYRWWYWRLALLVRTKTDLQVELAQPEIAADPGLELASAEPVLLSVAQLPKEPKGDRQCSEPTTGGPTMPQTLQGTCARTTAWNLIIAASYRRGLSPKGAKTL